MTTTEYKIKSIAIKEAIMQELEQEFYENPTQDLAIRWDSAQSDYFNALSTVPVEAYADQTIH